MGRPSTTMARRRFLDKIWPVLDTIVERNNALARSSLSGPLCHNPLTLDDFVAHMDPISSSGYCAMTRWVEDVFHTQRLIRSDLRSGGSGGPSASARSASVPGFTPAPELAPEPDSSDAAHSLAPISLPRSPPAQATFPPATQSPMLQWYTQASGSELVQAGLARPARAEPSGLQSVDDPSVGGGQSVLSPYHCPPQQMPSLDRWRESWPAVPHWGAWSAVHTYFAALERPEHELVLPPREVVRKYQLALLEKFSRIFDDVVETQGGLPAILNEQGELGSRIIALRHDIYRTRQVLGRAVIHTDFKANIIFNDYGNISVGPLPRSPLSPIEGDSGPSGVFAADPLEQMKADLFLLEYFHDLKDRLLAFTDRLSHALPRMAMAFSGARRAATEHANSIRLRQDRSLLLPGDIALELTDFDERGMCMIRYEDDDRMPMVRALPYVRRPNSILDPEDPGSPRLLRLLRGRGGVPAFERPAPDARPLVPFPRVAMSPPDNFAFGSSRFGTDLPDVWRGPAPALPGGNTVFDFRPLDPRSPRPAPAVDRGITARRLASRAALRRSSSRVSPREQYLLHASSEFDAYAIRRRADARQRSSPEEQETAPRARRDATPQGPSLGRRIAPLPRRAQ